MGGNWGRAERALVVWLCTALLAGSALLLWQQWRVQAARRELNAYLVQRLVPGEAGEPGPDDGPASHGEGAPPDQEEAPPGDAPAMNGGPEAGLLQVHVAGAVAAPGVYELPVGARAVDGVNAAGGVVPEADLDRINLAAPLVDGQQLYVPRRGDALPEAGAAAGGAAGAGGQQPAAPTRVNVNQAGVDALQQVPGIGPVLAARIVAYRQAHGPFRRVEDLTRVQGIGPRSLENMRPYLHVDGSS